MGVKEIRTFLKCQALMERYKIELVFIDQHNLVVTKPNSSETVYVGRTVEELHSYLIGYANGYRAQG